MKKLLTMLAGVLLVGSMAFAEGELKKTSGYAWGRLEYNTNILNMTSYSEEVDGKEVTAGATETQILDLASDPRDGNSDYWRGFMGFNTKVWDMSLDVNMYKIWDSDAGRTDIYLTKQLNDMATAKLGTTLNGLEDGNDFLSTIVNDSTLSLTLAKDKTEANIIYAINGKSPMAPGVGAADSPGIYGGYLKFPFMGFTVVAKPFKGWFNPTSINLTVGDNFWYAPGTETGWRFFDGVELYRKLGPFNFDAVVHANLGERSKQETLDADGKVTSTETSMGDLTVDASSGVVTDVTYGSTLLTKVGLNGALGSINVIGNAIYVNEGSNGKEEPKDGDTSEANAGRNLIVLDGRANTKLGDNLATKAEVQIVSESKKTEVTSGDFSSSTKYSSNDIKLFGRADMNLDSFSVFGKLQNVSNFKKDETTIEDTTTTNTDTTSNELTIGGGAYKTIGLTTLEINSGTIISSDEDKGAKTKSGSTNLYIGSTVSVSF